MKVYFLMGSDNIPSYCW